MSGTLGISARLLRLAAAGERARMLAGLVLVLSSAAVALLQPWPLKLAVDAVLGDQAPPEPLARLASLLGAWVPALDSPKVALLVVLCLSLLLLQALIGLLTMLSTTLVVSIGLRMVFHLRCRVFDHVQRLSLAFHDSTTVGDSLYRVTWDTYAVQSLFNGGVMPGLTAAVTLVGIAAVMLHLDWAVTLTALSIGLPIIAVIRWLERPMTEVSLRVHERESDVSARVQETLIGIRAVQAFGREELEGARFRRHAEASVRAKQRLTLLQSGSQAAVGLLMAAGTAAVIGLAGWQALAGSLTAGDLVLLVSYVGMLYAPLESLAYTAAVVQGAAASGGRVLALLDATPDVADLPGALELRQRARGDVALDDVAFGYRPDHQVLRGVRLDVHAGSSVALVGPSGAGKTTLISLLMRFYDPTAGGVTLDGRNLRTVTLASLRRNIALVLQEPVLFGTTIRENIAYGRPEATPEEVVAAARAAGAHEFIEALPEGYETQIGERGVMLSGGQRQRLSIARAFLKDAPILILDEPTSSLDARSEALLLGALERLMAGRTTFIIAHRLSTIRHADRILVMEDGQIVEEGRHAELLARDGLYASFFRQQTGGAPSPSRPNVPTWA